MRCLPACLLMLSLALAAPAVQAQQRLSLTDARALAVDLIADGQPAAALVIASGLLEANPRDVEALVLVSRAERALGNTDTALDAGRAAWHYASTQGERFVIASVMAQAHASAGQFSRAQLWLRRAAQAAPNDQMAALAARDYGIVRQANPWAVNLSLGIVPSNNINNGNSNATLTFAYLPGALATIAWEVPADDRPLSGVAVTAEAELTYRLAQTARSRTEIGLSLFGQGYVLSSSARATAPDVTPRSLGFQQATVSLGHSWMPEGASGPYSVELGYTHAIYGGAPYTRDLSLAVARQWNLSDTQVLAATAVLDRTTYLSDNSHSNGVSLRASWQQTLANDDRLSLAFSIGGVNSGRADRGHDAIGLQASYDFGQVSEALTLSVAASVEHRVFDRSSYDPAGREDLRSSLQVNMGLPTMAFYGFEPVATLSANRTRSSVPFFETEAMRLGLQLRSRF
jgi:tetratricopeptide (TPR) repeat protein